MLEFIKKIFAREDREAIDGIRKYQTVYNTPEGRWVLEDILNLANYGGSCIGVDDQATYLKLGAHNLGVEIAQRLTADIVKLEEASKKEENTDEQDV